MGKGHSGESCAEAIRDVMAVGEVVTFSDLFSRIKQRGDWKDDSIWQDLMAQVVNLPPARHHWKSTHPFLFLHSDGRYELYNEEKHPEVIE